MRQGMLHWLVDEETKTCTSCGLTYGDVKLNFYIRKPLDGMKGKRKPKIDQPCRMCKSKNSASMYEKKTKKMRKKRK